MTDVDRRSHWENIYSAKGESQVSWFENTPDLSLCLLREAGLNPSLAVIDIGGGASRLVDALVAAGQVHVTVLDLSATALNIAKARLAAPDRVTWIVSDVTTWMPDRQYDLWHDRATFHFLTLPEDRHAYVDVLSTALKPGGAAVIGTFAPDGPEKCSGLPVVRYDAESLQAVLGKRFKLLSTRRHDHTTPWGSVQKFQFSTFLKQCES
ncbi:class I SAM-dependent methyltransferase [Microvirga sp. 2TAF3]|uniref:class I SAM-dependent methyltransferase n=1 Tax=Microvirga sp. 2TAF3 TaxID=3233014 RepID=UPI003F95C620